MKRGKKIQKQRGTFSRGIKLAVVGSILLFTSFLLDNPVAKFFGNSHIPAIDLLLAILADFKLIIFVMLLVPTFFYFRSHKKFPKILWASLICSIVLSYIIKVLVARPRPIMIDSFDIFSFPSTHAMAVFSVLPFINKNTKFPKVFILYALIVAFSRVYFSYHYLSDVVFGALFGYVIGSIIYRRLGKS